MFDLAELSALTSRLGDVVAGIDADALDGSEAVEAFDQLDLLERLAAAGKSLVAAAVERTEAWRGTGARDAVGFLAARSKSTRAEMRDALAVAARVGDAPLLDIALRTGEVTVTQAADIAAAVAEHPDTEAELVELAPRVTPRELRARCVEVLARDKGADEQHERARSGRSASATVGRDGVWQFRARLPVIDGALVDKALDHFQTEIFDAARQRGSRDPFEAYRADALVAMARAAMGGGAGVAECDVDPPVGEASGPHDTAPAPSTRRRRRSRVRARGRSSSIRHAIVVAVPHSLFTPGGMQAGETCQVPGVGPVPASVVHELLEHDPIVKAVVTRGRDITALATLTRTIKEDLRLAVRVANEHTCAVPGCTNARFLELDHELEFHKGGPTSFDNLRPLCSFHHHQRTRENYELKGRPGDYRWYAPDGTLLAADRPPEGPVEGPPGRPPDESPISTQPPPERSVAAAASSAGPR